MKTYRLRRRWWRFLLDWIIWYGPERLANALAGKGLYWEEMDTRWPWPATREAPA